MPPKSKQIRREQTQHLCKICNIWIADNKAQRDQHETGAKHTANRQRLLREIADRNEQERAQARKEGRCTGRKNEGLATQQMMEIAMQATQREIKGADAEEEAEHAEGGKHEKVEPGQEVDENGYPLPASTVFQWITVDEEDLNTSESEREAHAEDFKEVLGSGMKRIHENVEVATQPVEDAEERSAALATFKRRKATSGQKKRRRQ